MDPTFALAHTGFADASLMAAFYGLVPPKQVMNQAKASAEMALKLDPSLCEPYCTLGCYYSCFEWNWEEAEKNFLRSLELNSKYVQAHYWYGSLFLSWIKGNFPKAEKHGKIATELEPLCSICHGMYASILHTAGKFDQAITACKTGIELDADSFITQLMLGWSYLFTKQYKEAIAAFDQLLKTSNRHHVVQNALIISYCITWKFDKARTLLNDLIERAINEYIAYTGRGFSQGYLEDVDEAFRLLEKAYEDREPMLLSIKYEHWVPTSIKEDPRYKDLLQQIGFPE
jgi:tetratricopeptide (TPR) repeat protein